jgi:nucleoside-diphosphate kinase
MERTLVLIKPDAIRRELVGEIISRFERKGLKIIAMKMIKFDEKLSKEHYKEHVNKPFYPDLEKFITSGPVIAMVLEGVEVIETVRTLVGSTNGRKATPGSIRGDFSTSFSRNLVHASDSKDSAAREIKLFFSDKEIVNWDRPKELYYASDE